MVTQSVVIRICEERDLEHFDVFGTPQHVDYCREQFARGAGALTILVAVDEHDAPVGKLHLDFETRAGRGEAMLIAAGVRPDLRSRGIGTALMDAAEEWGRRKGAVVAVTDTNLRSPISVPFYTARMGYERQAVILRKPLR